MLDTQQSVASTIIVTLLPSPVPVATYIAKSPIRPPQQSQARERPLPLQRTTQSTLADARSNQSIGVHISSTHSKPRLTRFATVTGCRERRLKASKLLTRRKSISSNYGQWLMRMPVSHRPSDSRRQSAPRTQPYGAPYFLRPPGSRSTTSVHTIT